MQKAFNASELRRAHHRDGGRDGARRDGQIGGGAIEAISVRARMLK